MHVARVDEWMMIASEASCRSVVPETTKTNWTLKETAEYNKGNYNNTHNSRVTTIGIADGLGMSGRLSWS